MDNTNQQIDINLKNSFESKSMDKSKTCHSGYVRLVKFVGNEKHGQQQMCKTDLLSIQTD